MLVNRIYVAMSDTNVRQPLAAGGMVTFKYDPFGRRIYKSSTSGTSVYAYDGDNLIEETNATGGVVARYEQTQNIDEPLAMLRSSATSYFHADGLGSITSLSNAAGSIANTYTYDSFGKLTASTGSLVNPFQYTARESDPETGLYYYRARYYDPAAGRFIGEDPLEFFGGIDFYAYVENDPINLSDPFGFRPLTDCEKKRLSKYIPKEDLDNADLHEDHVPWWLPKSSEAVTLHNNIYFRQGQYYPDRPGGIAALGHELFHVGQYRRGEMTEKSYIREMLHHGGGPKNKFEKPAYDFEQNVLLPAITKEWWDIKCGCNSSSE